MASLAGFADAKRPERNTPTPAPKAAPLGGTTGATPSPQLAGFAPAAKPLNGFAPAKPAAASGFAPAKPVATGFAAAKPVRARTGAAAIPPGREPADSEAAAQEAAQALLAASCGVQP